MNEEIWKDIDGYDGNYKISNFGRVKSIDRIVHGTNDYFQEGKIIEIANNGRYDFVRICYNGKCKNHFIHRLIAIAFIPNPNNYPCVNHKDENTKNNNIENLEWCTQKYNANYGNRNNRIADKLGKKIARYKNGKIDKIYKSQAEARKDGFLQSQISKCCNGLLKSHKGYEWSFIE